MQKGFNNFLNTKQQVKSDEPSTVRSDELLNLSRAYSPVAFCLEDYLPEAREIIAEKLSEYRTDLRIAEKLEKEFSNIIYINAGKEDVTLWWCLFYKNIYWPLVNGRAKNIARLERLQNTKKGGGGLTDADIARAKEHSIDELVEFKHGTAKCLWHSERTGSMHYYQKDNRVKCFGCGKSGDAIDVYQVLNGCDFISAVKGLI